MRSIFFKERFILGETVIIQFHFMFSLAFAPQEDLPRRVLVFISIHILQFQRTGSTAWATPHFSDPTSPLGFVHL